MGLIHIFWSIITGFLIGLLARVVLPGADHLSFLMTSLVGIAGSWLGGFLGSLISKPAPGAAIHPPGLILSVVGAVLLLLALRSM